MTIYPAVDIKDGRCVRLRQGSYSDMTVFGDDPLEMALRWQKAGARFLHVVDLDGARGRGSINRELIGRIIKALDIPVQTGGGIRTMADIDEVLSLGAARVILGTSAVRDPELVEQAVAKYGGRIAVGIDARNGLVAIEGWEQTSQLTAVAFARRMERLGVETIIYTDIARDGMLTGPNLEAMGEMQRSVSMAVIASGGVSSIDDLIRLKQTGVAGAIVGKAIYTGAIDLEEALKRV
ncbi:MAG TPA: 1-(5-phosphoribosyl)-5-[(5-phosphoribosylamino)methylideneamino]imidazole-4-carboxamide isomerase [Thermoclostridium caenicola]|uniref:1-(5-phosphoribosyl)-5-[(5-phosphoribosylamino)methylideneamino] imidazole-4-carboxamide isomerase n=1 Tax=Thermoclostridium caenicola TaxID=659425 RepID=A0A1M6C1Y3_9FIRM|nr:1-(5-phosphoribosyl)-5-[(5-phosphoribosylamino)methylideneamino]imidazole-4-carboxamide isomerase [Thermoclostridium caenicola]SHI54953.1 1-(5-phosphoribosyl)-5-[(5-phosphoribosylamino)methylideneamino] imidazole-4-carboxamide isomerase [Thermoclostridium caenicola]HOK42801.1 1-(5-phosphoribosyl)-5-[(5-phosphoribosylamino)methylideneamino]imidazole-4-carboxamide isomerase [Thermoclostridium caenicola]HOL83819.1 1-(5-phosphoribosyl)-5-[(5-phosphoribosylamino)methylideneamino]imidazole-4-carbox